jgi:hypothetical protein
MFVTPGLATITGDFINTTNANSNYGGQNGVPAWPYFFKENITKYEWNIYKRILTPHSEFTNNNQCTPMIQYYNTKSQKFYS